MFLRIPQSKGQTLLKCRAVECDYTTGRLSNMTRHLGTKKHKEFQKVNHWCVIFMPELHRHRIKKHVPTICARLEMVTA